MAQDRPGLKAFRVDVLKMTQAEFGAALGDTGMCRPASVTTVSRWERGIANVPRPRRAAMAARFDRTPQDIDEILRLGDDTDGDSDASGSGLELVAADLPWHLGPASGSAWGDFIGLTGASGQRAGYRMRPADAFAVALPPAGPVC